jgi:hypothetical protein
MHGILDELVGMIAFTDFDEWDDVSYSENGSPRTWYKFIFDPKFMYDGGYYEEGSLPWEFAHRGDTISFPMLSSILIENLFYNVEDPIFILEKTLSKYDLHVDTSKLVTDISVRLCKLKNGYMVEMNFLDRIVDEELFSFHYPEDGKKGIIIHLNGDEEFFSYKRLAEALGEILYALRDYFKRDIEITRICEVKNWGTKQQYEVDQTEKFQWFLRLISIGVEKQKRYWKITK